MRKVGTYVVLTDHWYQKNCTKSEIQYFYLRIFTKLWYTILWVPGKVVSRPVQVCSVLCWLANHFFIKWVILEICIIPSLTYGAQTWTLTQSQTKKQQTTRRSMEWSILGLKRSDKMKNQAIRGKTLTRDVIYIISQMSMGLKILVYHFWDRRNITMNSICANYFFLEQMAVLTSFTICYVILHLWVPKNKRFIFDTLYWALFRSFWDWALTGALQSLSTDKRWKGTHGVLNSRVSIVICSAESWSNVRRHLTTDEKVPIRVAKSLTYLSL